MVLPASTRVSLRLVWVRKLCCVRWRVAASSRPSFIVASASRRCAIAASRWRLRASVSAPGPYLNGPLGAEIEAVNARLNRKSTLEERRVMLRKLKVETKERVLKKAGQVALSLRQTTQQLSIQNQPTRLILEADGGVIVGACRAVANRA